MSRMMTIKFNGKAGQINIDTVQRIVVEPKGKGQYAPHVVIFFNDNGTRAADFEVSGRLEGLEFANYVLNKMIEDGAKYFREVAA